MKQAATILTFKHPLLRGIAKRWEGNLSDLFPITEAMIKAIEEYQAIGIAAPQVGFPVRVIAIVTNGGIKLLVNPEILKRSGSIISEEGCLSIPGCYGNVERSENITVRYENRFSLGLTKEETFTGQSAIVIQHEIDHLDGILFTDKATNIRYEMP